MRKNVSLQPSRFDSSTVELERHEQQGPNLEMLDGCGDTS